MTEKKDYISAERKVTALVARSSIVLIQLNQDTTRYLVWES